MRFGLTAAAIAAACMAAPASAATIVQTDSEQGANAGFLGFNPLLGTLNQVTLDIRLDKSRVWLFDAPVPVGTITTVDWEINGRWRLNGFSLGQDRVVHVPLTGKGTSTLALNGELDDRAATFFEVRASGEGSIDLDPADFIDQRTHFNGFDTGFGGPEAGTDTTFATFGPHRLTHMAHACFVSDQGPVGQGDDFCGTTNYQLTFDYTPFGSAVPEPATWVMLLVGFAAIGSGMRAARRPRARVWMPYYG